MPRASLIDRALRFPLRGLHALLKLGWFVRRPDGSFVLRSPGGFKRRYDAEGLLAAYEDRFGNVMSFHYDGGGNLDVVVDPYGRAIDFVFAAGRDGRVRLAATKATASAAAQSKTIE